VGDDRAEARERARRFLSGERLAFEDADELWRSLRSEPSLARSMLERMRSGGSLSDGLPAGGELLDELCQQHALLTSKDLELSAGVRHDQALEILAERFDLTSPDLDGDVETLGIAGGIHKRRFDDLGQLKDLRQAARYYQRGARGPLGEDAYAHINAAFLEDLLADAGDEPANRRGRADELRRRIAAELPVLPENWWNAATRAEAYVGLGDYARALGAIRIEARPEPWELQTTARQLARLARLRAEGPLDKVDGLREFFTELLGGSAEAVHSTLIGKVGLGLSGGGFRASFYHLGVLARLAELDVLRHLEVLSCVSGGSIVGACYWLALRQRIVDPSGDGPIDYPALVRELIDHFESAVAVGLRERTQRGKVRTILGIWRHKGALDSHDAAAILEEHFYRPLMPGDGPLYMDQLAFQPSDHDPSIAGSADFNPTKHNWLRSDNVPVLVINATTVNTGHAWQFTPTWMGESPWSVHEVADTVPRLEWHGYDVDRGWRMPLARAVAASACVPGVFSPVRLEGSYPDLDVQLVDGGLYDNQGATALLAHSCNVLLVSDAAGQLQLERRSETGFKGLTAFFGRSMETLIERIRQTTYGDLSARFQSGLLRGVMFVHMKDGLDAEPIRLPFSQVPHQPESSPLTPAGVRRDFQGALAEVRTDLNRFTVLEARALMACGYQMAAGAFERDLSRIPELGAEARQADWPFAPLLREITSPGPLDRRRREILDALREARKVP
jgi:predicted acylesterase/phospholipase RssA